jgi:hypothetical protein
MAKIYKKINSYVNMYVVRFDSFDTLMVVKNKNKIVQNWTGRESYLYLCLFPEKKLHSS